MAELDYTARVRDQLLDDPDDGHVPEDDIERQISEAQARYPHAVVTWDDELQDIVVDLSGSRWR